MGGEGSGRKSVKLEAIRCLLGVQMDLQELIHQGIDDKTIDREGLKKMIGNAIKKIKVVQEEVERI